MKKWIFLLLALVSAQAWSACPPSLDTIAFDNSVNSGGKGPSASYSVTWTIAPGVNAASCSIVGDTAVISTVKMGAASFTQGAHILSGTTFSDVWYLAAPATGSQSVTVTFVSAAGNSAMQCSSWLGVDPSVKDSTGTNTATSTAVTVTVNVKTANARLIDAVMIPASPVTLTIGGSQTSRMNVDDGTNGQHVAASDKGPVSTGNQTMTWTINASNFYTDAALALKPSLPSVGCISTATGSGSVSSAPGSGSITDSHP